MKHILVILCALFLSFDAWALINLSNLKNGDIIFHESRSRQSKAIQAAQGSRWSHMGFLYKSQGSWFVLEAIKTVQATPLNNWIARGVNKDVVIKRVKRMNGSEGFSLREQRSIGHDYQTHYQGLSYDVLFEWSDNKMYCSELVYKLFIPYLNPSEYPGEIEIFKDMNLEHPEVRKIALERYPGLTWEQVKQKIGNDLILTPVSMFRSPNLRTVYSSR